MTAPNLAKVPSQIIQGQIVPESIQIVDRLLNLEEKFCGLG